MKLVFAVDAIFPPLSGIGRYAWELGRRLERSPDVEDIRFFSMGRWVRRFDDLLPVRENGSGELLTARGISVNLRKRLSRQVWAVYGYSATMPRWMQYRLRSFCSYLYHSPNYFVPPFNGPSIATIHDLSIYKYPDTHPRSRWKMFDLNMASTLRRVSHLITDSESTRKEVIDFFGWPEYRITAVHLGVDQVFAPRPAEMLRPVLGAYGLKAGQYSLCVSTFEPRKRVQQLLTAYEMLPAALRERYPLVLAGDAGWLNESIHDQAMKGEKAGWVRCLGFVPGNDLPGIYAGARAFWYLSTYEGFGLPVLEAMASGVPVLTSDRSSLPEVADGAAWLVDPDDTGALTDGLRKVLEDADWRRGAVERGLKVAAEKTWNRCMSRTLEVYRRVLSE